MKFINSSEQCRYIKLSMNVFAFYSRDLTRIIFKENILYKNILFKNKQ